LLEIEVTEVAAAPQGRRHHSLVKAVVEPIAGFKEVSCRRVGSLGCVAH
jgi:predicted transcriptional regulator